MSMDKKRNIKVKFRNKECKECPQNEREDIVWNKGFEDGLEVGKMKSNKMIYINDRILVKKSWWSNQYKNNIIQVELLGKRSIFIRVDDDLITFYAVKLPDGEIKEIQEEFVYKK